MKSAADRMQLMIEGLLSLSRISTQGLAIARVDLSKIAEEILSDLELQLQRTGGKVELGALPVLDGDPMQLRQLFQNLISNALKYHKQDVPPVVKVSSQPISTAHVQILYQDNGIGFEERFAERIFQPFQRLVGRSQYEGTGMGLAICKRIIERHGGSIAAHSTPGDGSTFIITLPLNASHPK
jgi:signal transduction histidine kinase